MNRRALKRLDNELREYLESMVEGMGRPERRAAMAAYVTGLLLDGERKSIQPMAARLVDDSSETEAMRQRLQECVVISKWAETEVFRRLATKLEREFPGMDAYVIDDTRFPKKGKHPAAVVRQYSGTLGRIDRQLSGRDKPAFGRRSGLCLHRHAALFAKGLGRSPRSKEEGRNSR